MVSSWIFFYFWTEVCMLANWKMLILNSTLVFLKFQPKHPIKKILVSSLLNFIFEQSFAYKKIEVADVKKPQHSSFFESQPKNTQIKQFWSYILKILFFLQETLPFNKLKVLKSSMTIAFSISNQKIAK